jgi:hypothetical protein
MARTSPNFKLFIIVFIFFVNITGKIYSQVRINEVLAVNATINCDPQYYNLPAWIELFNSGTSSVNIGGYFLSDSRLSKTKWTIPANTIIGANSYMLIWCDTKNSGLHTNFDIDADGEGIYFYNSILNFVDSVRIPKQYSNISYGRVSNGSSWGYLQTPTPASMNGSTTGLALLPAPVFSQPSGRYVSAITLTLSSTISGSQIRYTTDGSEPTLLSSLYSSPLNISQTAVVKAKNYTSFGIPSETVTRTYFINEHSFTLPVVSVSMNPKFLWNDTIGIYVAGTNGITGNCSDVDPKNYNQDWSRYCVVEFFNNTGNSEFKKDFETKIYGACSRNYFDQKSLAFYPRKEYGKGNIEYAFFPDKNIDKYDNFVLRNSGNDCNITQFRDVLMQSIVKDKLNIDWQAYLPSTVYLNGTYWGVMNIREKLNENYVEHNAKVDADSIDLIEKSGEIIIGDNSEYLSFVSQLGTMNLWENSAYDFIDSNIDVEEFIHYYITQIYYANTDWPGNNIKFWQPKKQGGKWRWILFDTDFGFDIFYQNRATHATLNFVTDSTIAVYWPNPQWSTQLFRCLLKNPIFRNKFIQTFQASLNSVFNPRRINKIIDGFVAIYSDEMVYHKAKWGGTITDWNYEVARLRSFATDRYNFMPGHIKSFFNLTQPMATVGISVATPNGGTVSVNGIKTTVTDTLQLFQQIPYAVEAIPAPGYKFKQWEIKTRNASSSSPILRNTAWKYNDSGQNLGSDWVANNFNDASWAAGNAQFGYGEGDEATTVNYGSDASNKYITTYFRKSINIADTAYLRSAIINLLVDDGAVIYVNGTEATRFNMPAGAITYSTVASSAANENVYVELSINPALFIPGDNTVAVEIHQNYAASSDLSFDMDLTLTKIISGVSKYSTEIAFNDTAACDMFYHAEFEPKAPISNIYINEIAAKNTTVRDNYGNSDDWFELFNSNKDTIDLNGLFLSDNFSRKTKFQIKNNGTSNTKIPPYGYAVFWADEEEFQGNTHTSFKLSGSGERIGVFQVVGNDTLTLDTVTFFNQPVISSLIRYPDGAENWFTTATITPNSTNIKTVYVGVSNNIADNRIIIFPNPVSKLLNISSILDLSNSIYEIHNTIGKFVDKGYVINNQINCSNLKSGLYILTITNKSSKICKGFIKY